MKITKIQILSSKVKVFYQVIQLSSTILGATLVLAQLAVAAESPAVKLTPVENPEAKDQTISLQVQIHPFSKDDLTQVPSVSQASNWRFWVDNQEAKQFSILKSYHSVPTILPVVVKEIADSKDTSKSNHNQYFLSDSTATNLIPRAATERSLVTP